MRNSLAVASNFKSVSNTWSNILLLGVFPREIKVYVLIKTYIWMFILALSVIVKAGNKPNVHQQGMDKQMLIYPFNEILLGNKSK